ncbi:MAG: hypothetical protein COW02_03690 [Comamonadaceae bacterium CG12_big_fil_rev_8_21_14_0_65_59_15]|nr:MAG: hypothetical protein COW02_03690 [Comamonadaceae bacterium CG12_big_fil_rev_8_21_14_0_65_59_15]
MSASRQIRAALQQIESARSEVRASSALTCAVREVKRYQSQRFATTYQDMLTSDIYGRCARFFLEELYSECDYTQRDAQFAKVAGVIDATFPEPVIDLTVTLAQLHLATETLDLRMAQVWREAPHLVAGQRYARAWAALDSQADRQWQLDTVLGIGRELGKLTRKPTLRLLLKMMRQPAKVAGLGELQRFLESGFDHFAELSKRPQALKDFLSTIQTREQAWIDQLETTTTPACESPVG